MKALKKSNIIPMVADQEGIDEKLVKTIVDFYWKEVITAIRDMKHLNIEIHELGEVRVAKSKIDRYTETLGKYKAKYDPGTPQYNDAVDKLSKLDFLRQLRDEEYEKRDLVRQKRKKHDEAKESVE